MKVITTKTWLALDLYDLVHLFMQDEVQDENKPYVYFDYDLSDTTLKKQFKVEYNDSTDEFEDVSTISTYSNELEMKRYIKRSVKKSFYLMLSKHFNKTLPWGCLTGIRPTSVAYDMLNSGVDRVFLKEELEKEYFISPSKASLVEKVIKNQNCIIKNDKLIDLYINIPFCPTKCSYCSFISSEYCKVEKIIPAYIDALIKEINAVKQIIRENFYIVKTIYVGGGTPSVLSAEDLERILSELTFGVSEFTVECGRPDTITNQKLDVLKKYGVTRISINPQTFVNATLKRIGRKHTASDVIAAYNMALPYNFSINMDLIAGLPGESLAGFKKSITTALELHPDNITVHTLALKRGSELYENHTEGDSQITEKMVEYGQSMLMQCHYKPYYMYKLKNQNAALENVGFYMDKPCVFNIDSMEETASIIACGANAISKRIFTSENRIERQANVKFANEYIERLDEMIQKKKDLFSK